ncbi:RodZ domain-containing protein [Shewanella sedimentimangrovi]|uniref:DUF4115 domain-containing protein n=1 Tax=Shewanella sedimentimangrovi TaxID=2814293 RepID=A0ABX7QXA7_9GAMM|nr:RodZ domain-containing protein [Shewanella sedimentimangrovi]QSX36147.1 DUF4115 domain-containing protein [Shewanella sedimentimangrovi]
MNDEEKQLHTDEQQTETRPSLGAILQAAREARGQTVADVATALHLRPSIVSDIEADDFSNIASSTYVRGYVKNYARLVEADKALIDACLEQQVPTPGAPSMQSFSRKTTRQARDSRLTLVSYLIAIVLLALLVLWWVQKATLFTGVDFSKPTVEEVEALREQARMPQPEVISPQTDPAQTGLEHSGLEQPGVEQGALAVDHQSTADILATETTAGSASTSMEVLDETQSEPPLQDTQISATAQGVDRISFTLNADCWIQVTDASGKVLLSDVKKPGQAVLVEGKGPFKLILGAPQAVSLEFNGAPVSLEQYPKNRVARFSLPMAG